MNRRSLIKCILGLAAAPKILAELDFKPPIVANPAFKGLIPTILSNEYTVVEFKPGSFTIEDFHKLVRDYDKMYKPKYHWHETNY